MAKKITLLSFDQSSSCTGVSVFHNAHYTESFTIKPQKKCESNVEDMAEQITEVCKKYQPDIIVCEGVYENQTKKSSILSFLYNKYLQGVLKGYVLNQRKWVHMDVYYPSQWRSILNIKQAENGKKMKRERQKKEDIAYIKRLYDMNVSDDEADAICIGLAYIKEWNSIEVER